MGFGRGQGVDSIIDEQSTVVEAGVRTSELVAVDRLSTRACASRYNVRIKHTNRRRYNTSNTREGGVRTIMPSEVAALDHELDGHGIR